jgi:hypothetical protein
VFLTVMSAMQFVVKNVQRDLLHEPGANAKELSRRFRAAGFKWCGSYFE